MKKIDYARADDSKTLKKKQRLDVIKAKLSKFTTIKDHRECYLVHYNVS